MHLSTNHNFKVERKEIKRKKTERKVQSPTTLYFYRAFHGYTAPSNLRMDIYIYNYFF